MTLEISTNEMELLKKPVSEMTQSEKDALTQLRTCLEHAAEKLRSADALQFGIKEFIDGIMDPIHQISSELYKNDLNSLVPQFGHIVHDLKAFNDAFLQVLFHNPGVVWGIIYSNIEHRVNLPAQVVDALKLESTDDGGIEVHGVTELTDESGYLSISAYGAAVALVKTGVLEEQILHDLPKIDPDIETCLPELAEKYLAQMETYEEEE